MLSLVGWASRIATTVQALKEIPERDYARQFDFDITGYVSSASPASFVIDDNGQRFRICIKAPMRPPHAGDVLRVRGFSDLGPYTKEKFLFATNATVLGSQPIAPPRDVSARKLFETDNDYQSVRLRGCVIDVFLDEIDPRNVYLILNSEGESVYVTVPNTANAETSLVACIGAEVEIVGECVMRNAGRRMFVGNHLGTTLSNIRILKPAPSDPFNSPRLEDLYNVPPSQVAGLSRRSVSGTVLATWHGNRFLLSSDDSRIIKVELANPDGLPQCGQSVQAVGFPQTDLFHINLSRAFCRPSGKPTESATKKPQDIKASDIISMTNGNPVIDTLYHGKLVRLRGLVRTIAINGGNESKMNLEADGFVIPIDLSATSESCPDIPLGSELQVTGICLIEGENWRPSMVFPTLGGFSIIVRSASEITILSRPPWWTPTRLFAIILALSAALIVILAWNRILNRVIAKRTKQLLKGEIERAEADLRTDERTRLAVEIHDSLSQNLSGVACQIAALRGFIGTDTTCALDILGKAERMLQSCRTELRRCLWDLRGDALEEPNLSDAILKTAGPASNKVRLSIRFNVARSKLSDTLAHAVICIVRELVSNATQHGRATLVQIAGECHDGQLAFSVRDNGVGFDPDHRKRTEDGHFGLDGINERVRKHQGKLSIRSGKSGTKVVVSLTLPEAFDKT